MTLRWLETFPTTGARVLITLLIVVGTAISYWRTGTPPDGEWLAFLAVMSGVDALQAIGKRATAKPEVIRAEGEAAVQKIQATAAAVPPLTPKQAIDAGHIPDAVGPSLPAPTTPPAKMESQ